MKNLFEYQLYKTFIKDWLLVHKLKGGTSALAEAAGCDRTYLSQVLNSKVQLTPDHALGMAEYMGLNEAEQDYFLLLVLLDRAASVKAKKIIKKKMEVLVKQNTLIVKKISNSEPINELSDQQKSLYYSESIFSLVHTMVSTTDSHTVEALVLKTRLDKEKILFVLDRLQDMGLVHRKGLMYYHSGRNIHVPRGSVYNKMNHLNWRLRAVDQSNNENSLHYTTLFSISKEDWLHLKQQLLQFIEKQRKEIQASGAEEVYCFCCDMFSPN